MWTRVVGQRDICMQCGRDIYSVACHSSVKCMYNSASYHIVDCRHTCLISAQGEDCMVDLKVS